MRFMTTLPSTPSDVTPAWLTEALETRFAGADVESVEVLEIRHGTNSNALVKLAYRKSTGLPPTMFLKLPPLDEERRAAVNLTGMGRREALFYRNLADRVPMRVPVPYVAEYDDASGEFVLLLEDLDGSGCTIPDPIAGISFEHAASAMRDYAALHVRYEDPARRAAEADWITVNAGGSDYGGKLLQIGLDHHRDKLSDAFAELAELYIDRQSGLEEAWSKGPLTVLQGDGHIGNLFEDGERPGFLDWGLIHLGNPMRDVGYFIAMTLSPENRRAHERKLIALYLEARVEAGGAALSFDDAWLAHRVHASYTVPASCQIVTFPESATPKRKAFAAAFLARCEAAIEDLDARGALREVAGL